MPRHVEGDVVRAAPASFDDHFSQAALFYASLTSVEQQHVIDAYTFELGKCYEQGIKERALTVLAKLDDEPVHPGRRSGSACRCRRRSRSTTSPSPPRCAQIKPTPFPIAGRIVGVVAGPGADLDGIATLRTALEAEGALLRVIAPHGGQLVKGKNVEIVERTFATGRSIEFDAIVVADGAPKDGDFRALVMLQEAFRHLKAVGAWGDGVRGARRRRDRPGRAGRAHRQEGERQAGRRADRRARHCTGPGTAPRWWPRRWCRRRSEPGR